MERIRSRLAMVFQSFNLWSHMTIMQNIIEVPIQVLKVPRAEAIAKAEHLLNRVGLGASRLLSRSPLRRSAAAGRHRLSAGGGARGDAV